MKLAMIFPGQGSQSVGMLSPLAAGMGEVQETFAEASAVLGYDLWALCQGGPEDKLAETEVTQPAMLTAGIAAWRCWQSRGGAMPSVMAGHSLGEVTALVAAGSLAFSAAVELVRFRAQAMQRAVPVGVGAMAAILGLEDAVVEAACEEASVVGVVEPVNYNSPGQLVIAGEAAAVTLAMEACKQRGAKRALLLPVSVPSHSSLMQPAAVEFRQHLQSLQVQAPAIPVYAFDGGWHDTPQAVHDGLSRQLHNPVRWTTIVSSMMAAGISHVIECGPGKVLTGLVRRAPGGRDLNLHAIESIESLQAALAAVTENPTS